MILTEKDQQQFRNHVVPHLIQSRTTTCNAIVALLESDEPRLLKHITKASGKIGPIAYIGRYLLSKLKEEGWLINDYKTWKVKITPDRCAQCFKPLYEVYYITSEKRFCNDDCANEFNWDSEKADHVGGDDPYWDEYSMFFNTFSQLYPQFRRYKKLIDNDGLVIPIDHIQLLNIIQEVKYELDNEDYQNFIADEGRDGPLAAEIYRMLSILDREQIELRKVKKEVQKHRGKQKRIYAIIIDRNYISDIGKGETAFKEFVRKNRRYKMTASNMWGSKILEKRNQWYDDLKTFLGNALGYKNIVECPLCTTLSEENYTYRAIDDFRYCENCYDRVRIAGGFGNEH